MKKFTSFGLCAAFCFLVSLSTSSAQESRPRRAADSADSTAVPSSNETTQKPLVNASVMSRQRGAAPKVLTNEVYVRPTALSRPANAATAAALNAATSSSAAAFRGKLTQAMNNWFGTAYRYGSEGPNSIDCSALVWRIFNEAGISFDRTSARGYWNKFPVATEEEKYQFGTLVFFNDLGHMGVVVDENTFYHASVSKGVTFSKFDGYWQKRIVGFRRIPLNQISQIKEILK